MLQQAKTRAQYYAELADPPEARFRRDPVAWGTERAGLELWSKQREILTSIRDNRNTAVKSCHSAGKSFISAVATCWWLDVHPPGEARVITTAPTSKQVDAVLWYEINKLHTRLGLRGQCNLREWYLGKQLVALGRKPPDYQQAAFQGLHAKYLLVIYDEAYGIPTSLWNEGSSLASNEYARQLAIGNPDGPGDFQDNCAADSGWKVIHISYRHSPNFTGEKVSPELGDMLVHPDWVEERRRRWGEHSALFASKCEGDFPDVGGDPWQIVPNAWAQQCRYLEYPGGKKPVEAGVDVGGGNDRTVVCVREGNRVKALRWFVDPDPMKTIARVAEFLREHGVTTVKVDSIGIGWGIYGRLRELSSRNNPTAEGRTHDADVIPINVSLAPTLGNEARFTNRRAEMWWDVGREHCRLKTWDLGGLPADLQDDVINELCMARYEIMDSKGKVKVEPKEEIIKRLKASPDLAEALLLAFVPSSWTAVTHTTPLLAAPSLLDSFSAFDSLAARGW